MRKIIQIQEICETSSFGGYMMALCDDGTVWDFSGGKWSLLEEQIPQNDTVFLRICDLSKGNNFKFPIGEKIWEVQKAYDDGFTIVWYSGVGNIEFKEIGYFKESDDWSRETIVEVIL